MALVLGLVHAQDVWTMHYETYSPKTKMRELQFREDLQFCKREYDNVKEYMRKYKSIYDSLSAMGAPMPEKEKNILFLKGLGQEYHTFVTTIRARPPLPSFREIIPLLISEENLIPNYSPTTRHHEVAFTSQGGGGQSRGRSYRGGHTSFGHGSF
ncbi:hypothetical protein GIB67_009508 [Kingdonia uniflora]|uniref:Uncharacterized protein n=1 Tax=Kingdonia uniflora TaxID=39325 RepID=A0A7J7NVZ8_9MAGN|nr:hypothetical protein GIB67_009508 [Kingdonia uniflora]